MKKDTESIEEKTKRMQKNNESARNGRGCAGKDMNKKRMKMVMRVARYRKSDTMAHRSY